VSASERSRAGSVYGRYWDYYVESWEDLHSDGGRLEWPGDEWGHPEGWEGLYRSMFVPAGVAGWERAVEIGPGSGKYTLKVIESSSAVIRGYDVSAKFLEICDSRCAEDIRRERLSLHLLGGLDPDEMLTDLRSCGWERRVDAFFSINSMVHVDLQYLIVYLITAGLTLRPGGRLVLTLANAVSDLGFEKLVRDIAWTFPVQGRPLGSGKFEWLGPEIALSLLPRLGFEIDELDDRGRDLALAASLTDPARSESLRAALVGGA
jgi:SAM-dependent methyltransferase